MPAVFLGRIKTPARVASPIHEAGAAAAGNGPDRVAARSAATILALMERLRGMSDAEYLQCLITYHAAPTLLGIKPATLVCPDAKRENLGRALDACVPCLARAFGVRVAGFQNGSGAPLYFIYRPELAAATVHGREARTLLTEVGYQVDGADLADLLGVLRERCAGPRFPHEIGIFLGYPAGDVRRFMADGGRGCRMCGCWKAYGDEREARRRSRRYRTARLRAARLIVSGADLRALADGLREFAA